MSSMFWVSFLLAIVFVRTTTRPAVVTGLATVPTSTSTTTTNTVGMPPPLRLKQLLEAEMESTPNDTADDNDPGSSSSASPLLLPCCYDGLTARLIARAGFAATFMTGFGVSAVHGVPDTQLLSYGEMHHHATIIAEALASVAVENNISNSNTLPIPCIADGDTGYGNAVNVKRTVFGYGRAVRH